MDNYNQEVRTIENGIYSVAFYFVASLAIIWLIMVYLWSIGTSAANSLMNAALFMTAANYVFLKVFRKKNSPPQPQWFISTNATLSSIAALVASLAFFLIILVFNLIKGDSTDIKLDFGQVSLLILFAFGVCIPATPYKHKGAVFHALAGLFIALLICLNFTVFENSIVFTSNGAQYVKEKSFPVSPFVQVEPVVDAPPFEGTFLVQEVPEDWNIMISYRVSVDTEKLAEDARPLTTLLVMLEEGVVIPQELYSDTPGNSAKCIDEYLERSFPFLTTYVRVEHTQYGESD